VVFAIVFLVLFIAAYLFFVRPNAYIVTIGNTVIGTIHQNELINERDFIGLLTARINHRLDTNTIITEDIRFTPTNTRRANLNTLEQVLMRAVEETPYAVEGAHFVLNGEVIATAASMAVANEILENIGRSFVPNSATHVNTVAEGLRIVPFFLIGEEPDSIAEITTMLSATTLERITYTVQSGDTVSGIANFAGITQGELQALNPQHNLGHRINAGLQLTLEMNVPVIEFTTEEISDDYRIIRTNGQIVARYALEEVIDDDTLEEITDYATEEVTNGDEDLDS